MSDKKLIAAIEDHMQTLFDTGHTFWHCATTDKEHEMPFWYFQRNRSKNMSTCSTCSKLLELKRQLHKIDPARFPLRSNFTGKGAPLQIGTKAGAYNANMAFAGINQ